MIIVQKTPEGILEEAQALTNSDPPTDSKLKSILSNGARQVEIAKGLMDKGVPFITAVVRAGDMVSAEAADVLVAEGMLPSKAIMYVGSYARFDWAYKNLPAGELVRQLPELWAGADPDDTDPRYVGLWKLAFAANDKKTIFDASEGTVLPDPLTVYRGQLGYELGISWTTNHGVATKFAATGGGRAKVAKGRVLTRKIKLEHVMAYLTSRGEFEVIVDHSYLFVGPRSMMISSGASVDELLSYLATEGYFNLRVLDDGTIIGNLDLLYTRSLVIDLDRVGWGKRYCYENRAQAVSACKAMSSGDDEPLAGYVASRGRV